MEDQEIEVKFFVSRLQEIEARLVSLGAVLLHPRTFENNLRFDTQDGSFMRQRRVLRLRQDSRARLTYKGPAEAGQAAAVRQEIEFEVGDFNTARHFLEALGYRLSISYEKYRSEYAFYDAIIALDELPYGCFVEIEGPDVPTLQVTTARLGLDWEARIIDSYLALFGRLREKFHLDAQNLSFAELNERAFNADDLGVVCADTQ